MWHVESCDSQLQVIMARCGWTKKKNKTAVSDSKQHWNADLSPENSYRYPSWSRSLCMIFDDNYCLYTSVATPATWNCARNLKNIVFCVCVCVYVWVSELVREWVVDSLPQSCQIRHQVAQGSSCRGGEAGENWLKRRNKKMTSLAAGTRPDSTCCRLQVSSGACDGAATATSETFNDCSGLQSSKR